ncbi:hypothetical protein HHI36_006443 [Cryptolaemus montrouzieri]|uniref:Uncharacterized protein n=1 Tax=Cryptolaemus montrouzieri TaxID=559131 RepID=A0ABD2NX51_9CUCU
MLNIVQANIAENLKAGLRKCWIFQMDMNEVLKRIPICSNNQEEVQNKLLEGLPARKSVCVSNPLSENEDIENEEIGNDKMDIEEIENVEINSKENDSRIWLAVHNAVVRNAEKLILDENSSDDINFDEIDAEQQKENEFLDSVKRNRCSDDHYRFATVIQEVDQFVFTYENRMYPRDKLGIDEEEVMINSLEKSLEMWKWPSNRDVLSYNWEDVLGSIKPTKLISK